MKKSLKAILISASLMALSAGALTFASLNNKEVTKTSATTTKELYVQVRDISELYVGDTVLIASGPYAVGGIGGNPCFTFAAQVGGGNGDWSKFYFDSTQAMKLKVEAGDPGGYSFKSLRPASAEVFPLTRLS